MRIIENTTEFHIEEKTAIAIGKFDGIHRGHRELFARLAAAGKRGLKTAVFTFSPSPAVFFGKEPVKELTTREEKRFLFAGLGIDYLVEYPFNAESAAVAPANYVKEFLLERMNGALVAAGEDITFGDRALGDAGLLMRMAQEYGFSLEIIPKITYKGREISSTYVRQEVAAGRMETARELLGEPYFISGVVENGKKLGRTLGIPTANLYPPEDKLLPKKGVYLSRVIHGGGAYAGVTNIGSRPTIQDGERISAETFLLDFDGDLYGETIKTELLHFEREEKKFSGVEELSRAVEKDIAAARSYVSAVHS